MQIAAHETGKLHVLAVNRPAKDIAQVFTPTDTGMNRLQPEAELLQDLTGLTLNPAGAELIPLADLEGLGLSGYLTEGQGIAEDAVAPLKRKLDALEGYALILTSQAFRGQATSLAETADLTHIASFDQPGTDWSGAATIPSQSALPHSAPRVPPREARRRATRLGGMIFALFMAAIIAVIWMIVT